MATSTAPPSHQVRGSDTLPGLDVLHHRVIEEILAAISDLKGPEAASRLDGDLGRLHLVIDAADVGLVRDRVLEALRQDLLLLAVQIGREVLDWTQDFHVDDYLILRVNFPYAVARHAAASGENPGIGRVSPSMRAVAASRRVKDPVYDPKSYHRDHPPPAWAHGPHLDSWAGHSRDGFNVWWAISEVPAEAGMVLYPELAGAPLACDRRSLYLSAGHRLPPPTFLPLAAGEMLIFDPEILHGTHLNVTDKTRVAISLRLNAAKPTFDPASFYAREFWRTAGSIERGETDAVLHLKREEHLSPDATPPTPAPSRPTPLTPLAVDGDTVRIALDRPLADGERVDIDLGDRRLLLLGTAQGLRATDGTCPHYGLDLVDGGQAGDRLHCPGCAIAFDLRTGRSPCADLTLGTHHARQAAGEVVITLDRAPDP
ncbi:hypothetical protein DMC25_18410 [Caulobacter sp. D4A]|uniref:Rieske 2Fe-2S domain-containing protein n=1 Tax=unclassified Caulobacter TaxID=2648921 RepID=UPI000D72F83C|nr:MULTISPECIES: Rieske 2Fe-2S domain-containing protein [unclassified Caulobacter]PXA83121.1 hypothetical protein DMC25_18410 [Caulobacter sp. D4A]PXA96657.1 hypothetical protein DMC18_00930 [Caulobacter sp. D5]